MQHVALTGESAVGVAPLVAPSGHKLAAKVVLSPRYVVASPAPVPAVAASPKGDAEWWQRQSFRGEATPSTPCLVRSPVAACRPLPAGACTPRAAAPRVELAPSPLTAAARDHPGGQRAPDLSHAASAVAAAVAAAAPKRFVSSPAVAARRLISSPAPGVRRVLSPPTSRSPSPAPSPSDSCKPVPVVAVALAAPLPVGTSGLATPSQASPRVPPPASPRVVSTRVVTTYACGVPSAGHASTPAPPSPRESPRLSPKAAARQTGTPSVPAASPPLPRFVAVRQSPPRIAGSAVVPSSVSQVEGARTPPAWMRSSPAARAHSTPRRLIEAAAEQRAARAAGATPRGRFRPLPRDEAAGQEGALEGLDSGPPDAGSAPSVADLCTNTRGRLDREASAAMSIPATPATEKKEAFINSRIDLALPDSPPATFGAGSTCPPTPAGAMLAGSHSPEVHDAASSTTTLHNVTESAGLRMTVPKVVPPSPKTDAEARRLAELEERCQHLQQSLSVTEQEKALLNHRVSDLEANAARITRELERRERQVDELSIKGAELSQQLAERENEVSAYNQRAALLEQEVHSRPEPHAASSSLSPRPGYGGTQVLSSPDDEEDHLGNAPTLAALRQRLYRQYDGAAAAEPGERFSPVAELGSPVLRGGDVYAVAGTGGSGGGSSDSAGLTTLAAAPGAAQWRQGEAERGREDPASARIQSRRHSSSARTREPVAETTFRLHTPRRPTATWGSD